MSKSVRLLHREQEGRAEVCGCGRPRGVLERAEGDQTAGCQPLSLSRPWAASAPACGKPCVGGLHPRLGCAPNYPGQRRTFEPGQDKGGSLCLGWPQWRFNTLLSALSGADQYQKWPKTPCLCADQLQQHSRTGLVPDRNSAGHGLWPLCDGLWPAHRSKDYPSTPTMGK